jgi:hypothetical protein
MRAVLTGGQRLCAGSLRSSAPTGPTNRLPGVWPGCCCARGTAPAPRDRTACIGPRVAPSPRRPGSPGEAWCPVPRGGHAHRRTRRPDPWGPPRTAHARSGTSTQGALPWRTPPPGDQHPSRPPGRPPRPPRGGVVFSFSGPGQPSSPVAGGNLPPGPPDDRVDRPRALVPAVPTPHGAGEAGHPRRGGARPGHGRRHLGPRPRRAHRVLHSARRHTPTMGREAAPVWRHPRRCEEAARHPRASSEAGARRTPGRGSPAHGSPRDHPARCWLLLFQWLGYKSGDNNAKRPLTLLLP